LKSLLDIRVQKLFVIVLALKIASSGAGWLLGMPWSLGFAIPLALMTLSIVLGLRRRDDDVGDEKFADTCYYIGFIFTITSIVFALFDLPSIGTEIGNIAVRFGAAMVSTVLGLGVRVYLVSFGRDTSDAIEEAEDAVIDASHRFREQLVIAIERLRDFESDVDLAAKASVERVNLSVEALSKGHADKLDAWLAELTARNQQAFADALAQVGVSTAKLAEFVEAYSNQMRTHMTAMQQFTSATTDSVLERLRTAEFPEDYFARHLSVPMRQLKNASEEIADNVQAAAAAVSRSSLMLLTSMKKMRDRSTAVEGSLDSVQHLAGQQQQVLHSAQDQLDVLRQLAGTLAALELALRDRG
jgi:hypothetical protein